MVCTSEMLIRASRPPATKTPLCTLHQPRGKVALPPSTVGPEHRYPASALPTRRVTKGHPVHWVRITHEGGWMSPCGLALSLSSTRVDN